uniref:Uncharacterized protein n=1 Tax=Candidatus Kentrum sp. UNK TaxID=2126344 RepID=A0A451AIG2_9GAMM|nr:MAG: hypothetical protein BECKUNK1418G_GA0071005_107113 [Candidatus Kentron sp. UNK]VFK71574.1 MAG: hypothetical protein BECKUNK1418H_GA0071006_107213 [Candidatus Kentron sp. UNK]
MNQRRENIKVETVLPSGSVTTIDPSERLRFARQILLGLAVICVAVFVGYAWYPGNKALIAIFELVKIGILPLATLIVAFYFPKSG